MFSEYWWIVPLVFFVIPIIWAIIRESQPRKIDKSTEYNLKNADMLDVPFIYIIGWCVAGALIVGHFI